MMKFVSYAVAIGFKELLLNCMDILCDRVKWQSERPSSSDIYSDVVVVGRHVQLEVMQRLLDHFGVILMTSEVFALLGIDQ